MIDVGSAVGYLMLDTSNFRQGFRSAFGDLKTFEDKSATALDKTKALGSSMTSVGSTLTKSVTIPLAGLGTAAATVAASFESSMSKVASIAGLDTAGKEFDMLSDKAKEMGATTKFSASEAADAFSYMAMAGWKTEDMLNGIEGVMSLAAASGEDLALTSDIVTDALTAFGLTAKDSSHFADVLAAASNNANTNVAMLGESFKYVAPVAGSLKYSAEDTSIALGLMANSGIKASQAGTVLRASLTNMVKPTDQMAVVMEKYGLSLTDTEGNMKPLLQVMKDLREKFGSLDEATQANAAATLFGKEAMSGMLAIINASDKDFDKLTEAIYNADGTATSMADTMQDNLTGQLTILKSALEGLAISFGDILLPMLTSAVKWITNVVDKFNSLSDSTKTIITIIGGVLAALGPLLLIVGKTINGFLRLRKAIILLKPVFLGIGTVLKVLVTIIANPLTIIAGLLIGFMVAWDKNLFGIQDIIKNFGKWLADKWESFKEWLSNVGNKILSSLKGFANKVKSRFKSWIDNFRQWLNDLVDAVKSIRDKIYTAATNVFNSLWNGFKSIWSKIIGWFKKTVKTITSVVKGIGSSLYDAGKSIFTKLWDGLKSVWTNIKDWVKSSVDWIVSKVKFWEDESDKVNSGDGRTRTSGDVDGHFASGLDYVPRDMTVRVHEGESILTRQQTKNSISEPTKGGSVRPTTVILQVDKRELGRATVEGINDITDTDGRVPLKV